MEQIRARNGQAVFKGYHGLMLIRYILHVIAHQGRSREKISIRRNSTLPNVYGAVFVQSPAAYIPVLAFACGGTVSTGLPGYRRQFLLARDFARVAVESAGNRHRDRHDRRRCRSDDVHCTGRVHVAVDVVDFLSYCPSVIAEEITVS